MKGKHRYENAIIIAQQICEAFKPYCTRIEIAGSLRRESSYVGDIEIVAIPVLPTDLFGMSHMGETALSNYLEKLRIKGKIEIIKSGPRYTKFHFDSTLQNKRYQVDMFTQPDPKTWGVNFLLRTGSADFSKLMVTRRTRGGALPRDLRVHNGRIHKGNVMLETDSEADFFELCGLPLIEPKLRNAEYLKSLLSAETERNL